MKTRIFGRLGWDVSEIGHGMWGMGGQWKGSSDEEARQALLKSYELGCTFYDTAWIYGQGHSEKLFGEVLSQFQKEGKVRVATKIPPKNLQWPGRSEYKPEEVFPYDHIIEYTHKSIENLGVDRIDLLQLHVWDDSWTNYEDWQKAAEYLKQTGIIEGFGISVNKWEPNNAIQVIKTGLVDSVQLVYNIFEQAPEDELLPICKELNIGVIARVPFDEGTLTGNITMNTVFEPDDWRNKFFTPKMRAESLSRLEEIKKIQPENMSLAELALKFILHNTTISTVIPGMRNIQHVSNNIAVSDGLSLDNNTYHQLKSSRWDRSTEEFAT